MRTARTAVAILAGLALLLPAARGQKPAAPAPAPLPAINPGQARLDQTLAGLEGPGLGLAATGKGELLVAACEGSTLQGWREDVSQGVRSGDGPPRTLHVPGHLTALAAAGDVLATAGADGKVLVWDPAAETVRQTLEAGAAVRALALAPGGKVLATTGDDGGVRLWEVATGQALPGLAGSADWLLAVTFSPDGKQVAAAGYSGFVYLWDVATGTKPRAFPSQPPPAPNTPPPPANVVWALAFSPDGSLLAGGGSDGQVHLWQAADGKLLRSLAGHTGTVSGLAFHPGGAVLVSASRDRTLRLWNPASGQPLKVLEGHTAWVQGLTLLSQGTRIASVSADRTVRLWSLK